MSRRAPIVFLATLFILGAGYFVFRGNFRSNNSPNNVLGDAASEHASSSVTDTTGGDVSGTSEATLQPPTVSRERDDFSYTFWLDAGRKPIFNIDPYPSSFSFEATYPDISCEVEFDYAKQDSRITVFPVVVGSCYPYSTWYTISGTIRGLPAGLYTLVISPQATSTEIDPRDLERQFEIRD